MPKIIRQQDTRTWNCVCCGTEYETSAAEILRLEIDCPDCGHHPETFEARSLLSRHGL